MTDINRLTQLSSIDGSMLVPLWDTPNGGTAQTSLNIIKTFINQDLNTGTLTQFAAPSATGFTIQVNNDGIDIWLVITPVAGYAAGTLILPLLANCDDKQEIKVNCTQSVTALTINGNGATVTGAPTVLSANSFFTLKFEAILNTWYRVG